MTVTGFILGMMFGGCIGLLIGGIMAAGKRADEIEKREPHWDV